MIKKIKICAVLAANIVNTYLVMPFLHAMALLSVTMMTIVLTYTEVKFTKEIEDKIMFSIMPKTL